MKWSIEKSRRLYKSSSSYMPGGCSSNARIYPIYNPHPIFVARGKKSRIWDVDGNEYIDLLGGFGALILGHTHPKVMQAMRDQLQHGTIFGTPSELELEAAKKVSSLIPGAEMVRFVQSGGEATMSSLRLARGYTGKNKVIKFEGHYHGAHDYLLASIQPEPDKWGPRSRPSMIPASIGIPSETLSNTIILPWNDAETFEKTVKEKHDEIAAVITEPIMGNGGLIFPRKGYLESLRETTERNNILLIFDEVVTGFRFDLHGAQGRLGVTPDITTLAKAMGGGAPVAALCGKREVMKTIRIGGVWHAGTYNANMVAVAGANATLDELKRVGEDGYGRFHERGKKLIQGLRNAAEENNLKTLIPGFAGFFTMFFTDKKSLSDWREVKRKVDPAKFEKFAWEMYKHGVYLHPDYLERINVSMAHTEEDIHQIIEAARRSFKDLK